MCSEKYIKQRLEQQINWYDQESISCKKASKAIKLVEMTLSALVPIVIGFWPNIDEGKFFVSLCGATVVVLNGIQSLYNFHERWIQYRSVCEALRHEKYLFETRSGVYAEGEKPFAMFVERVENMISNENINWAQIKKCPAQTSNS